MPDEVNPEMAAPAPPAPSSAPEMAPPEVQSAPPTTAHFPPPAAPAAPAPPQKSGEMFKNLSHAFIGSVLGAMAGREKTTGYTTDETGKQTPVTTHMTSGDQLRQIARSALLGLAAGANAPKQKSGVASALGGLGAGAESAVEQGKQDDQKMRKQSADEFDRSQKAMLQKAGIAHGNALMYATYSNALQNEMDHDPERQSNLDLAKAAEAAGIPVRYMTADDAMKIAGKEPGIASSHSIRPIGFKNVMDEEGKPVLNADGTPKRVGQIAFIPGLSDDKVAIPQSFVDDAKKFAALGGATGTEALQAGHEIPINQLLSLETAIQTGRKTSAEGWMKGELGWGGPNKDVPTLISSTTGETKPVVGGVIPASLDSEKAKGSLYKAQASEAYAKGKEALANASQTMRGLGTGQTPLPQVQEVMDTLKPATQSMLKGYPPEIQAAVLAVSAGDADVKIASNRVKGTINQLQLAGLADAVHMDMTGEHWTEALFPAKQALYKGFADGKDSASMASFNQFLGHAGEAADVVSKFKTSGSPLANKSINWLRSNMAGDPAVTQFVTAITPVREEYFNFLKNNLALNSTETQAMNVIMNDTSTPDMVMSAIQTMVPQAITRLDQINEKWRTVDGRNYPNLVTPSGKEAATKLGFGDRVAKYGSGGQMRNQAAGGPQGQAPPKAAPAPTTHVFDSAAWQKANPTGDVNAAKTAAQAAGYEVE